MAQPPRIECPGEDRKIDYTESSRPAGAVSGDRCGSLSAERPLGEPQVSEAETVRRLLSHFDNFPFAVVQFDPQFRVSFWSKGTEEIFGWQANEILGCSIPDMEWVYEEDQELVRLESEALLSGTRRSSLCRNRNYRKDGSVVFSEWRNSAIYDAEGQLISILSMVVDLTAQMRAERLLKESEQRYRSLFEHMLNGYAYCRVIFEQEKPVDFVYLAVNQAFEELTGLRDVVGKRASEVIPGIRDSDPQLIETYGRVALTGNPETFETFVEALSMWFSVSVYSPETEYFVAVFDVITRRKEAEEALRKSERRLKLAQTSAGAGVWDWDMTSERLEWSPELFELFGLDPERTVATFEVWDQVLHPDDKEFVYRKLEKAIEQGVLLDIEYRVVHPNGEMRWIKALGSTVKDDKGIPFRMAGICLDITA